MAFFADQSFLLYLLSKPVDECLMRCFSFLIQQLFDNDLIPKAANRYRSKSIFVSRLHPILSNGSEGLEGFLLRKAEWPEEDFLSRNKKSVCGFAMGGSISQQW
jgi:hypothetical protein